jgi:hypothetical protein
VTGNTVLLEEGALLSDERASLLMVRWLRVLR